jgi:hypothetical protein
MSILKVTPDGVSEELAQITSAGQFSVNNPPQAGIVYTNNTAAAITTTYPSSVTWAVGEQKTYTTTGATTLASIAALVIGDAKSGFQTADHNGWIKLDGRLKSTLTATQQANATALGFGVNLPDATGRVFAQGTLAAQIGSSTITQANLPSVNLSGGVHNHAITDPSHSHAVNINNSTFNGSGNGGERYLNNGGSTLNSNITSNFGGSNSATGITVNNSAALSIPLGGSGLAYIPAAVGVNQFVYLAL